VREERAEVGEARGEAELRGELKDMLPRGEEMLLLSPTEEEGGGGGGVPPFCFSRGPLVIPLERGTMETSSLQGVVAGVVGAEPFLFIVLFRNCGFCLLGALSSSKLI